jgi:hypothetical protein
MTELFWGASGSLKDPNYGSGSPRIAYEGWSVDSQVSISVLLRVAREHRLNRSDRSIASEF